MGAWYADLSGRVSTSQIATDLSQPRFIRSLTQSALPTPTQRRAGDFRAWVAGRVVWPGRLVAVGEPFPPL